MARVPYAEREDLPEEYRDLIESSLQGKPINVYRAMGVNPELLYGEREFAARLWSDTGLDGRERELVILSVAAELRSRYEWQQHANIAPDEGVSTEEMVAIGDGRFDAFDPAERALARYAVAVVRGEVDDDRHDALAEHYDDSTIVGTALLAAGYELVARFVDALDVDLEGEFVGWRLENVEPRA